MIAFLVLPMSPMPVPVVAALAFKFMFTEGFECAIGASGASVASVVPHDGAAMPRRTTTAGKKPQPALRAGACAVVGLVIGIEGENEAAAAAENGRCGTPGSGSDGLVARAAGEVSGRKDGRGTKGWARRAESAVHDAVSGGSGDRSGSERAWVRHRGGRGVGATKR